MRFLFFVLVLLVAGSDMLLLSLINYRNAKKCNYNCDKCRNWNCMSRYCEGKRK